MKSFRLQFVDIDSSYSISTAVATIKGFIVARAPKGTTEAMYFEPTNTNYIEAMVGRPSADWPDLFEAEAFNNEYGLYISAPAGSSSEYPSYYGGVYLTKNGIKQFWHVTDRENPNFEAAVTAGYDSTVDSAYNDSVVEIVALDDKKLSDTKGNIGFKISNISAKEMGKMSYFNVSFAGKTAEFHISDGKVYFVKNGSDYTKKGADTPTVCGTVELDSGKYTIEVGCGAALTGADKKLPCWNLSAIKALKEVVSPDSTLDLDNFILTEDDVTLNYVSTKPSTGAKNGDIYFSSNKLEVYNGVEWVEVKSGSRVLDTSFYFRGAKSADAEAIYQVGDIVYESGALKLFDSTNEFKDIAVGLIEFTPSAGVFNELLLNGTAGAKAKVNGDTKVYEIGSFVGLKSAVTFRVNIKDDVFLAISQKCPNETPTHLTISNIGYDKYVYDVNVPVLSKGIYDTYYKASEDDEGNVSYSFVKKNAQGKYEYENAAFGDFISELPTLNVDNLFAVVDTTGVDAAEDVSLALYELKNDSNGNPYCEDVTKDYATKDFFISAYFGCDTKANALVKALKYTIWYIESAGDSDAFENTIIIETADGSSGKTLRGNALFDTVTFDCKEEVIPGSYTTGGEFTGSMEETGVDAAGAEIYFPTILTDDSVTFVNAQVVNTLEDLGLVNAEGFWTGTRIVDSKGPAVDTYSFSIVGQRYACKVMNDNLLEGKNGGVWRDDYAQIIKSGITEAMNLIYDDALVFMEPTGEEQFKAQLAALRAAHDTSTIISPKNINQAQFEKPETIPVAGRSTGTAQYIGEFRMRDSTTKKYYYCKPIGDVGLMLARIMDKKLGGVAPAGTNDSQGCGGTLPRAVISAKWNFVDSQLKTFDEKGLNAITYDAENGLMIQAHKTTQDPANVTDWSFLAHSMSFDLCKREIRDKVMTPQLFKKINDYWMSIRQTQVEDILAKRTTGSDPIWASASCDISGVNTIQTKLKRQFVMKVTCKVNVTSESVLLMFENLAQDM